MMNTNVLICCSNSEDSNVLTNLFLKYGYGCTVIESFTIVKNLFSTDHFDKNKFKFIILGMDFSGNQSLEMLQLINNIYFKDNNSEELPIIIVMSMFVNKKMIQQMQTYHVTSFFKRPLEERRIDYELNILMYKYKDILPEKQPVFIEPDEQELMRGNYKLKNGRHESVKITELCINGAYICTYNSETISQLKHEDCDFIEHFIFEANNTIIDTDARIIFKDDGRKYYEFTHFYGNSREYLLDYIKSKII